MDSALHVPTMLIMIALASGSMAVALAFMRQRQRQRDGLGLWALGLVLHTLAYGLYVLRGQVPDWASVVLANALLSCTFASVLAAICQFHGRPLPWISMLAPVAVTAGMFAWFVDDQAARTVISGTLLSVQLALALWALWRPSPPLHNRGALLLTLGCAMQMLLLLVRAGVVALQGGPSGVWQPGGMQWAVFMAAFVVVVFTSLGFILMTKDRADAENLRLATHDALTGSFNRRALIQALERDVARAQRTGLSYALMLLDIDHFKQVNDTHGHLAGDAVLRHVVQAVTQRVRSQDLVGRYGGEEIVVLLPDTDLAGAQTLAQTLCQGVAQTPCSWGGKTLAVTVSIGVFGGTVAPQEGWDSLLEAADRAMYHAKKNGRNQVHGVGTLAALAGQ